MRVDVSDAAWAVEGPRGWEPGKGHNLVFFYDREIKNNARTIAEGRPCYDLVAFLKIVIPGDKNLEIDRKATERDKMKYEREWEAFVQKREVAQHGTPLEHWSLLDRAQVAELKALKITTVDQLATLPDSYGGKIMGFQGLKQRAQAFLSTADKVAEQSKVQEELGKRDETIKKQQEALAATQAQLNELMEQMKVLAANQKQKPGRKPRGADPPATD